jgi:hypothetical protein
MLINVHVAARFFAGIVFAAAIMHLESARSAAPVSAPPAPNADFREGETSPTDWRLSGGTGRWVDRDILDILVWESTYWISRDDIQQNPYLDPMGYVGGSRPEEKKYWGNGDGRFVYPPLAAAAPGISGAAPVIEPPVASIRWEMLREGIEDYEYLWMLRERIAAKRPTLTPEQINSEGQA